MFQTKLFPFENKKIKMMPDVVPLTAGKPAAVPHITKPVPMTSPKVAPTTPGYKAVPGVNIKTPPDVTFPEYE